MRAVRLPVLFLLALVFAVSALSGAAGEEAAVSLTVAAGDETAAHLHTDPRSGVSFMIPDGWTEETFRQGRFYGYDAYTRYEGPSTRHGRYLIFMHIVSDEFSRGGKSRFGTRQKFDEYYDNPDTVYMLGGALRGDKSQVEFNGVTYYKFDAGDSTWQYFIVHNGYLHMFQFDVNVTDPNYAYFVAIMNSVVFPENE